MFNFLSHSKNYRGIRQLLAVSLVFFAGASQGQVTSDNLRPGTYVTRSPASYIPDDDVIVKPVDNEISFYQRYVAADQSEDVVRSRNQLKIWHDNQVFAEQYGVDSTLAGSPFYVPTENEKLEFFKSRYMRYLRSRGEQPFKDMPKTWYNDYRASNEVDTIDELETRFKSTHSKTVSGSTLPGALQEKEVSIWKKTRVIFQPRVDQGLIVVGIRGPIAYARAWVGINGRTEFNVQKNVESIGLRFMWNYEVNNGRYFSSIDKRLMDNLYLRVTSIGNPIQASKDPNAPTHDNTLMLLYAKQF